MSTAQLVFSDKPSYCEGYSIALHAIALPNPTYSWTGPNGFTSTSQRPVIYNITTANSGAYKVTITSSSCGAPTEYTLNLTVNGKAQASEVLIPSIVTVLHGSKAQLKPSAASNVQTPSFSWYDSQTSLAPLYSHAAGGHFETSPLTKDTTYYVAVSGSNMCENTVSNRKPVYVRILNIPEMALTDICSTNPYIALNNTYTDNTYTWEYSVDGTGSWQPELTTTTETKLNVNKEGFYRLSINHNGMPAYNVSQGIQVILNRKVTLPGGILWYDMSYNLVTINW